MNPPEEIINEYQIDEEDDYDLYYDYSNEELSDFKIQNIYDDDDDYDNESNYSESDYQSDNIEIIKIDENEIITDDYTPIYTFAISEDDPNITSKTKSINKVFSIMLQHFTFEEQIIIHSIWNYNQNLLDKRNDNFKEVPLIKYILSLFNIELTSEIFSLLFPLYPFKLNHKKVRNAIEEIKDIFDFNTFKELNKINKIKKNTNIFYEYIEPQINSYLFFAKNVLLIPSKREEFIETQSVTLDEINIFIEKYLSTKTNFLQNYILKKFSYYLRYKVSTIILYYFSNGQKDNNKNMINNSIAILFNFFSLQNYKIVKDFLEWKIDDQILLTFFKEDVLIKLLKYVAKKISKKTSFKKKINKLILDFLEIKI